MPIVSKHSQITSPSGRSWSPWMYHPNPRKIYGIKYVNSSQIQKCHMSEMSIQSSFLYLVSNILLNVYQPLIMVHSRTLIIQSSYDRWDSIAFLKQSMNLSRTACLLMFHRHSNSYRHLIISFFKTMNLCFYLVQKSLLMYVLQY